LFKKGLFLVIILFVSGCSSFGTQQTTLKSSSEEVKGAMLGT